MWIELLICIISLLWIMHFQKRRNLPSGPFSVPFFGTLELFTTKKKFLEFLTDEKHYKCYKDFCSFFLGPSLVLIVINEFLFTEMRENIFFPLFISKYQIACRCIVVSVIQWLISNTTFNRGMRHDFIWFSLFTLSLRRSIYQL